VALGDRNSQLLADVARKVEVDVGDSVELAIDEASKRQVGLDWIDVREPGQIADDRADRTAACPSGWRWVARRAPPADLVRHVAGELQHLVVEQEEAGEAELVDQLQLLV